MFGALLRRRLELPTDSPQLFQPQFLFLGPSLRFSLSPLMCFLVGAEPGLGVFGALALFCLGLAQRGNLSVEGFLFLGALLRRSFSPSARCFQLRHPLHLYFNALG